MEPAPASCWLTRAVFLCFLGLVHAVAFLVLAHRAPGLRDFLRARGWLD